MKEKLAKLWHNALKHPRTTATGVAALITFFSPLEQSVKENVILFLVALLGILGADGVDNG